jgi:predicted RecB family endonuclease
MLDSVGNEINNYERFEECIAKIFEEAGYDTVSNVALEQYKGDIDIVAKKDDKKYYVEVKYARITEKAIHQVCIKAEENDMHPILVTAQILDKKRRDYYQDRYSDLVMIDISNLLYAVRENSRLRNDLISTLSYSVEDIEPLEGAIEINSLQHDNYTESLIREMDLCKAGRPMARKYEELCRELLQNVFFDDLVLWKEQQNANGELHKFDLLCRIKDGNQKTFWSILERYFNSKYVVFEFKNYKDSVTQKEIYTTEKYLYSKALRSVGIMIAANGYEENARWAAKGCLRENGKLILLLETKDLIEMNRLKEEQEDPSEYLQNKLDELLLELEK